MPDESDSDRWRALALRGLRSPALLMSALILVAAAIGLRPALAALQEHYRKQHISLRRPLDEFDVSRLASFEIARGHVEREELPYEAIGTEQVLKLSLQERSAAGSKSPAVLFVTYYSDPEDKVPHTPEVCYRQIGTIVERMRTVTLDVPGLAAEQREVDARLLLMKQPDTQVALIYLFCVNGDLCYDRNQVRWQIGWPGDPYIYFSKIEAIVPYHLPGEEPIAIERCKKLMREVLPVLLREYYPETRVVKGD